MSTTTTRRHGARGTRPTQSIDHRTAQAASRTREPDGLPVVLLVSSDLAVLHALEEDLGRRFATDTRIVTTVGPQAGLTELGALAETGAAVALLIVDQRMPEMTGVDFLARAHKLHRSAKRMLLVTRDYSSANPIIPAMTLGQIDYHLVKPWLPDHGLYPAVSEALASWAGSTGENSFTFFRIVAPGIHHAVSADLETRWGALDPSPDWRLLLQPLNVRGSRLALALQCALIRDHLPGNNVHVETQRLIPRGAYFDAMMSGLQTKRLRRRCELTNRPNEHVVHEQLRGAWCDVEAHTAHVRVAGGLCFKRTRDSRRIRCRWRIRRVVVRTHVGIGIVERIVERVRVCEGVARPKAKAQTQTGLERVVRVKEAHRRDREPSASHKRSAADEAAVVHEAAVRNERTAVVEGTDVCEAAAPHERPTHAAELARPRHRARAHASDGSSATHWPTCRATASAHNCATAVPAAAPTTSATVAAPAALCESHWRGAQQYDRTTSGHQHSCRFHGSPPDQRQRKYFANGWRD